MSKVEAVEPVEIPCVSDPISGEIADLKLFKDGDQWCATLGDFENLEESSAGFGPSALDACVALAKDLSQRR